MIVNILYFCAGVLFTLCESCDDTGWTGFEDHCYLIQDEVQVTWQEARVLCLGEGGDLTSIHSQTEQEFIEEQVSRKKDIWIGINQLACRTTDPSWSDGTLVNYTNWAVAQPMDGDLTSCSFMSSENGSSEFSTYLFTSVVYGMFDQYSSNPTDVDGDEILYFGQNPDQNYSWCESQCRSNATCAAVTFYESHYLSSWNGVCIGRSDKLQVLGPDNYGLSGVKRHHTGGTWKSDNCGSQKGFVCKKVNGSSIPLTVPPTQIIDAACPEDYFIGEGNKCYKLVTPDKWFLKMRWHQALEMCRSQSGILPDLASIHSNEDNTRFSDKMDKNTNYWIGGRCVPSSNKSLIWTDNTDPVYNNLIVDDKNSKDGYCIMVDSVSGKWKCEPCDEQAGYICQVYKDVLGTTTPAVPSLCPLDWKPIWNGCILIVADQKTWPEAKAFCESQNATLVTMHSASETDEVYQAAEGLYSHSLLLWIGLYKNISADNQSHYVWLDGRGNDFPKKIYNDDMDEACVAMLTSEYGQACDCTETFPSACQRKHPIKPTLLPATDGSCSENWIKWGISCYFFSPSKVVFQEAVTTCHALKGGILEIENSMENDLIKSHIQSNEQMSTLWIGLVRNSTAGAFHWLSNSNNTYRNWSNGEPKTGEHMRCASINNGFSLPYPGAWVAEDCDSYYNFICKAPQVPPVTTPTTPVPISGGCPTMQWVQHENDCYLFRTTEYYGWFGAQQLCQFLTGGNGSLVSITDYIHNQWVLSYARSYTPPDTNPSPSVWIGLCKNSIGKPFLWMDGNPSTFRLWAPGEPNDKDGSQLCVRMYLFVDGMEGYWDDYDCNDGKGHGLICKTPKGNHYTGLDVDERNFKVATSGTTDVSTPGVTSTVNPYHTNTRHYIHDHLLLFGSLAGVVTIVLAAVGAFVCLRCVKQRRKVDSKLPEYNTLVADSTDEGNEQINL